MSTEMNSETRIAALEAAVAEQQEIIRRLLAVPMVCMALGAETVIRNSVIPQPKEKSHSDKASSVHPADQEIKDGLKLKALAAELGR